MIQARRPTLDDLRGMEVSVLGAARSGVAAANLLARAGVKVRLSDPKPEEALARHLEGLDPRVELVTGRNDLTYRDLVVVSPGIPPAAPIWEEIRRTGARVVSEIELGAWFARAPMIAVTGTDGKSTTVSMVGAVIEAAGLPTAVLGNIGRPLCDGVEDVPPEGILAVEVSCFQLLHVDTFRPKVAVLMNLAQDHLDYHPSMEHYVAAKLRVFQAQGPGDVAVLSATDPGTRRYVGTLPDGVDRLEFSGSGPVDRGVGLVDGHLVWSAGREPMPIMARSSSKLIGAHNGEDLAAAAAATLATGLPVAAVARGLSSFPGLPHRLEVVRVLDGVTWVNDSKATSPHAAQAGLDSIDGAVWLIAGGVDKGLDLTDWVASIIRKAVGVVLIGELADRLDAALRAQGATMPILRARDMAEAVTTCRRHASAGEYAVLSPGCSSFDMFRSYEHRGEIFRKLVLAL